MLGSASANDQHTSSNAGVTKINPQHTTSMLTDHTHTMTKNGRKLKKLDPLAYIIPCLNAAKDMYSAKDMYRCLSPRQKKWFDTCKQNAETPGKDLAVASADYRNCIYLLRTYGDDVVKI